MTEFITVALAGIGLGLLHSLDPDHLAAMSTLVGRRHDSRRADFFKGALWGVGHTIALAVFGAVLIAVGAQLSGNVERLFEGLVGLLLIVLGLRRLNDVRRGPHLHSHRHGKTEHSHVHLHPRGSRHHADVAHAEHSHAPLWVGLLHGVAGTGGVMILLPVVVISDLGLYLLYLLLFGFGSILSMGIFCAGFGSALQRAQRRWQAGGRWLAAIAGTASLVIGVVWIGIAAGG